MKLSVFMTPVWLAACITMAVGADPQKESDPRSGGSSWSHRHSYSWGDAPRFPPNWPAPPQAAGPGVPFGPMPGFGQGFQQNWNLPEGAFSSQVGSSSNSTSFLDTPVVSALATAQVSIRDEIVLTPQAADVLKSTDHSVTFSATDLSSEQLISKIVEGSGCAATKLAERIFIHTDGEVVEEDQVEATSLPFKEFQLKLALARPVTLTMHFTPLPFVTQMLEGMCGVRIELPLHHRRMFHAPQPLVSLNAQGKPLAEVLEDIARQVDAEVSMEAGVIRLQKKSAK